MLVPVIPLVDLGMSEKGNLFEMQYVGMRFNIY